MCVYVCEHSSPLPMMHTSTSPLFWRTLKTMQTTFCTMDVQNKHKFQHQDATECSLTIDDHLVGLKRQFCFMSGLARVPCYHISETSIHTVSYAHISSFFAPFFFSNFSTSHVLYSIVISKSMILLVPWVSDMVNVSVRHGDCVRHGECVRHGKFKTW